MKKSQRSVLRLLAVTTLVITASALSAVSAQAAYVATATETAQGVLFEGTGTLDTSAWIIGSQGAYTTGWSEPDSQLILGQRVGDAQLYKNPVGFTGPTTYGPGTAVTFTSDVSGDVTGVNFSDSNGGPFIFTPVGYQSGTSLVNSTTLFASQTFATMGLMSGQYEWTWGAGASADSFKLNIGAVPIPAAVWLFGSGLLGLIGVARRKKAA